MKKLSKLVAGFTLAASVLAAAVAVLHAAASVTLTNESALAYSKNYVLDTNAYSFKTVAAQVTYGTATLAASSFGNGATSSGTITVADNTALSSASAVGQIFVASTGSLANATVYLPGQSFTEGVDFAMAGTSTGTAVLLSTAISNRSIPWLSSVSVDAGSITLTAVFGSRYNYPAVQITSDDSTDLVLTQFTGGQDNAVLNVNGRTFTQGAAWSVGASSAATADSIVTALNADSVLSTLLTATSTASGVVTLTSLGNGALSNYAMSTSTPAALAPNSATMTGGVDAAFTLNAAPIALPNNVFTLALPVLFTVGSGTAPGGLVAGTTYFAIPGSGNEVSFATTSARALSNQPLLITSSSTQTTANSFTFTPLPFTGTAGFEWEVSNDGINFDVLTGVSSVTFTGSGVATWNFGTLGFRYLELSFSSQTAGGAVLDTTIYGQ